MAVRSGSGRKLSGELLAQNMGHRIGGHINTHCRKIDGLQARMTTWVDALVG
jgi:hypothetical protein